MGASRAPLRWRLPPTSLFFLVVVASVGTAPPPLKQQVPPANASSRVDDDPYRLTRSVLPSQYTLRLIPALGDGTFEGRVEIEVEAKEVTNVITLHAEGIAFGAVSVARQEDAGTLGPNIYQSELAKPDYEMVDITLTEDLVPEAKYVINIEYKGTLRDNMYGFYISSYVSGGETKKLAATQFEATHARKAFPCFDEPSFKARFKVSVFAPTGYEALGNMPIEKTEATNENGQEGVEYFFVNSMIMSSYLVAFVVSDFKPREPEPDHEHKDVTFKTWAREDALDGATYNLEISGKMLQILEEYTGIPYTDKDLEFPLDKVDQVALPDFAAGAMENWGLITYRETALLYNDGSADAKKRVATTIAHELLHMWFGNLITTSWWDTTWLNEGFARYFQYYVTAEVETDWHMWDQFLVDQHQMVFALDALSSAEALTHDVSKPSEVSASFGTITYSKGGSILRMISDMIRPENFQSALETYLKDHKYGNVHPQDLFDALKVHADAAGLEEEDFDSLLVSWTTQPGFPVVTVTRNYETKTATVSQKRFLFRGERSEEYYVPLTWTDQEEDFNVPKPKKYLTPNEPNLELDEMPSSDSWVIFNVQETGYYRVNYDAKNWKLISTHLKNLRNSIDDIHRLNRAQLLDDAFNLARAGILGYETAFDLADYLVREKDYIPWSAALTALSYLDRMLVNHAKYPVFKRYVLRLIDKAYENFHYIIHSNTSPSEFEPSEHDRKLQMNRLATRACSLDHELCNEMAVDSLRSYHENNENKVNPDLRSVVYCYGIRNDGDDLWDKQWTNYGASLDDVERGLIVAGLACSDKEERLKQLLQYSIEGGPIRKQDASSVFSAVYTNPLGVEVALDFLDEKFDSILNYYGSIDSILTGIAGRLTTDDQRKKLADVVENHQASVGTAGQDALDIVDDNLNWLQNHVAKIFNVLDDKELDYYRLPLWVKPEHYSLYLSPSLEDASFTGKVSITVTAEDPTDIIILHSEGIDAQKGSVKNLADEEEEGEEELWHSHTYDTTHEFLNIHLTKELAPENEYKIDIEFKGKLRDNMYGFYLSTYKTKKEGEDGEEEEQEIKLAATQFQPTHARQAFPCFDEPSFKANFTVTINTPPNYNALGNMPAASPPVSRDDSDTEVTFLTTPRMSTYLLAFVVSDFEFKPEAETGDVEFKTWARRDALPWADYSIQVSSDILQKLEYYTDIKYIDSELENPFTKVDQVAMPDFSAGAMENWGLITYRETMLLFNDGTASARKSIATVIAHELAHMWFGNLVTTRWWDTTWLNEGFAQYLMFLITDEVEPSWRLMDQFVFDHHQGIMTSDALSSAAALTSPAYTPSQVSGRFSSITYSKGASILRMLSAIMGKDNFRDALRTYLENNRYSTTVPEDLFEHLTKNAEDSNLNEESFEELLFSWTREPGFPVINVTRDYDLKSAIVSQERFLLNAPETEDSKLYYVPLTWVAQGGDFIVSTPQEYLTNKQQSLPIEDLAAPEQWVIFNVQETGFYRVNYDATNWRLISDFLRDDTKPLDDIHLLNRAQLLDDAFNLARAGQLQYETVFYLTDYLPRETDYVPWSSALSGFAYLQRMLAFHDDYGKFEEYILHLIEKQYGHFNFEDQESHIDRLHLNRITAWACSVELEHCTESAKNALREFIDNGESSPADLRSVVYCYGIRHSTNEYWDGLLEEYVKSQDNAERSLLMAGLACSNDKEKLEELLQHSIDETVVRKQDASSVFTSVYSNKLGVEVALDFLDENFDAVEEYYGSMGAINNIVVGIAGRLTTEEQKTKMEEFLEKHSSSLGTTVDTATETVNENLEWLSKYEEIILDLLERDGENNSTVGTEEPDTSESPTSEGTNETGGPGTSDGSSTPEIPSEPDSSEENSTTDPTTTTTDISTTTEGAGSIRATALAVLLLLATTLLL